MIPSGLVTSARVTYDCADVDGLAAAGPDSQRAGAAGLLARPGIEEAFVLSTCNRVEAYVVGADSAIGRAALEGFFADVDDDAVVVADHGESLKHLLRVACGLESVVLGEDQILGQVREAYEDARYVGGVGPLLDRAVTKAIHVGERARTETAINEGIVSLGSAAVRLAASERSLDGATALVVGAGEMGRLAARSLAAVPVAELVVANRTVPHAEHVAAELDVETEAVPLSALGSVAPRADVVVAATGSDEPLLGGRHLGEREQVVVDLGQPRDVAPAAADADGVTVYDLDDLESVTDRTHSRRAEAAREVETMIEREFDHLQSQYKRARADDVIATMYESAERIKRRELETAFSRLGDDLDPESREVIEAMADSLVGQLLAPPTESLRDAAETDDWRTIHTALRLFDPSFGDDRPSASAIDDGERRGTDAAIGVTDDD